MLFRIAALRKRLIELLAIESCPGGNLTYASEGIRHVAQRLQKRVLIGNIEGKLQQKTTRQELLTVRWTLA